MNRSLIKISGEAISGVEGKFDFEAISTICQNIKNVASEGIGVSLVVGGGNIIRGRDFKNSVNFSRKTADAAGMLATVINGIILRDSLRLNGLESEIVSTLRIPFGIKHNDSFTIADLINKNRIIIFCGGVGLPYFSTDTISIVAAFMSNCNMILKATKADGIYDKDPNIYKDAKRIPELTYQEAIDRDLKIMDKTAFALAEQKRLPIHILCKRTELFP
ncbi:MAG: hypothetical protein LBM19_03265 [Holosporales bacterium]|jgi:uridylate kinase|nr:hypothetical protein [Holosporales bacterium]